jgi:hypothetical protein
MAHGRFRCPRKILRYNLREILNKAQSVCMVDSSGGSRTYGRGGYSIALASVNLRGDLEMDSASLISEARMLEIQKGKG